jgi:DnaK suppressor protein
MINKEALKEKIEIAIGKLNHDLVAMMDNVKPISPENSLGRVTRMDAINNKGVAEAAIATAHRRMSNLKLALQKIDSPGFGICSRCRNPIQEQRLMFMPESTYCIRCAQ